MNMDDDKLEQSLTIRRFCELEDMSAATYHKLQRRGLGPHQLRIPGMNFVRITPKARAEWHGRMEAMRQEQAYADEVERQRAHARHAGKIAAQSPSHISNVRRGRKAVGA